MAGGPATDYTNNYVRRFVLRACLALCGSELDQVNEPGYSWVSRHTWQSWRERYKKNSARLDVAIANIVSRRPVIPGEKGQYGYVRLIEEKGKKVKKTLKQSSPIPLNLHGESGSASSIRNSVSAPGDTAHPALVVTGSTPLQPALVGSADSSHTVTLSSLEESQEGGEWAIRIGTAPPPSWNKKRALSREDTLVDDPKRMKVDSGYVLRSRYLVIVYPNRSLFPGVTFVSFT